MNEYVTVVLGIILLYQAAMAFFSSEKYTSKLKGKYTPESLAKYAKVTGAGSLIGGLVLIYVSLNQLGFIKIGPDFSDRSLILIVYGIALAILVALFVIAQVAVLKPLEGASGKKEKNLEDEDY